MAFPFSWSGEVNLDVRDGPLPSADIAAGRIDAAIGRIVAATMLRQKDGLDFTMPVFEWRRFGGTIRQKLRPFLGVNSGSVRVVESSPGLRIHWELRFGHAFLYGAWLALASFVLVKFADFPRFVGILFFGLNGLFIFGSIPSDITEFPELIRRAVRGEIEDGPEGPSIWGG